MDSLGLLIEPHYQAIVSVTEALPYAWEVLFRFKGEDELPANIIRHWERTGYISIADTAVVQHVKRRVSKLTTKPRVAVNASARTIQDAGERYFGEVLHLSTFVPRVIVEITETFAVTDLDAIATFVRRCYAHQIYVGLDDCVPGDQFSEPHFLREVRPSFLKLDSSLIRKAEEIGDSSSIETIVRVANACRARTIIEGIDSPTKLNLARKLGVTHWQGFLGGRPSHAIGRHHEAAIAA